MFNLLVVMQPFCVDTLDLTPGNWFKETELLDGEKNGSSDMFCISLYILCSYSFKQTPRSVHLY